MKTGCVRNCKKGDCNGDCKKRAARAKSNSKHARVGKDLKPGNYRYHLRTGLLADEIKKARKERNLTREELGLLARIRESQISKLEKDLSSARLISILSVFKALDIKLTFSVELPDQTVTFP